MKNRNFRAGCTRFLIISGVACCAVFTLPHPAVCGDLVSPIELSLLPEAQSAYNQAVAEAHAQQPDWERVTSLLRSAQQKAPVYPPLLFNLGMAHAKFAEQKPGHALAAISWLQAYLVATPDAPNADDVRQEIARMRGKVMQVAFSIYDQANKVAAAFPESAAKQQAVDYVYDHWIISFAGNKSDSEISALAASHLPESKRQKLLQIYAERVALIGDIDRAKTYLAKDQITSASERDKLRGNILDALVLAGRTAETVEILRTFDEAELAKKWQFDRAITLQDAAAARRVIERMENTVYRDAAVFSLFNFYMTDDNLTAAYDLLKKMHGQIAAFDEAVHYVLLAKEYLAQGDLQKARTMAAEAKRLSHGNLIYPEFIFGDQEQAHHGIRSASFFNAAIDFLARTGQIDAARHMQDAALRELKGDELATWRQSENGDTIFAQALLSRVDGLIVQGNLRAAKDLIPQMPSPRCKTGLDAPPATDFLHSVNALVLIAKAEIDGNSLQAATQTIAMMPDKNTTNLPFSKCLALRANALIYLARGYRKSGDIENVRKTISQVNNLIWNGALSVGVLFDLAKFHDAMKDVDSSSAAREVQKYARLSLLVTNALIECDDDWLANLDGELEKIRSNTGSGGSEIRMVPQRLAEVAGYLADRLEFSDIDFTRPISPELDKASSAAMP